MILADKIILFRKKNNWSQEEFAEKMGVSRQSVSKWESAQSIPELDKILLMSRIFGVSTDFLLKDEIEEAEYIEEDEDDENGVRRVSMEEATAFLTATRETAPKIAFGVALCILSPVLLLFLLGGEDAGTFSIRETAAVGIGVAALLLMVAAAVALFVINGMKMKGYEDWEKEPLELEYGVSGMVKERQKQERNSFVIRITVGVSLCVLSPMPLFISVALNADSFLEMITICLLLVMVAVGVFLLVTAGMEEDAKEKLLQEGDYTRKAKKTNKTLSPLAGIYWCAVTALYLGVSFYFMNWNRSWIIWPVAAVLFAAIWESTKILVKKKEK